MTTKTSAISAGPPGTQAVDMAAQDHGGASGQMPYEARLSETVRLSDDWDDPVLSGAKHDAEDDAKVQSQRKRSLTESWHSFKTGMRKWLRRRPRAWLLHVGVPKRLLYMAPLKRVLGRLTPKGLYPRALLIIITPIVLLEGVVAFVFMERHWASVTKRLSEATARDIAALIEVYKTYSDNEDYNKLTTIARDKMDLSLSIGPAGNMPDMGSKPFYAVLERVLANAIRKKKLGYPFSVDAVGDSGLIEIQVQLETAKLRFITHRNRIYESNSLIFFLWMVGTSIVLLTVAILFLRNQIKPIIQLAESVDAFGKGQPIPEGLKPHGAHEVRQATQAFIDMSNRIKTHVEQRTFMLAGISHDLRTVLTRFKLDLDLTVNEDDHSFDGMRSDVDEMHYMLEEYLAFTKGDSGERASITDIGMLLNEVYAEAYHFDRKIKLKLGKGCKKLKVTLKRQAIKRVLNNLLSNAARFGKKIHINASIEQDWLRIDVEDNGPGIAEQDFKEVFKPFFRLDHARNQDEGNTGLGLAIAHDIAHNHGGGIVLGKSETLGGLMASLRLPL